MVKRNYVGATQIEKDFLKTFNAITYRHNPWTVWTDFVNMSSTALANAVDREETRWNRREQAYLASAKRYDKDELQSIIQLYALTVQALEENPAQDFLGNLYMNLDFGSSWTGQFFTPWHVAEMMARINATEHFKDEIDTKGFVSVNDPACGAGCMLIAFAHVCKDLEKVNYQERVLFVAQDIDKVVAQMCYIQLALLGCAGYVIVGDTLTSPPVGPLLLPRETENTELWPLPMFFSTTWAIRRAAAAFAGLLG